MKTKTHRQENVNVITLGCSKNLVDSEVMMSQLEHNGYQVQHDSLEDADIVIVNTCGFIDLAKQESIDTILQCAELKKQGDIKKLYVSGCLSQRYKDNLEEEIPEVDAFFGTMEMPQLLGRLEATYQSELVGERLLSTPSHYAYLKISEGCNRTCSFCAIPLMRGKHISKSIEALVKEATHLASIGVKEIILIAQELTYYGLDLYKKRALYELLEALQAVEGIEWIRLHYAYPKNFPTEILRAVKDFPKICKYLDIPLQHASDPVLDRMRRQITKDETEKLLDIIRSEVPGIAIRTTFLVGFPGETEEDFETLCEFVKEQRFDRVGVFKYSHEEDTRAYELEDDIADDTKESRASILMDIQREISEEKNQQYLDHEIRVLIDREEGGYYVGRSEFDSPEVDNEILISSSDCYLRIGEFAQVKIYEATAYDLYATVVK